MSESAKSTGSSSTSMTQVASKVSDAVSAARTVPVAAFCTSATSPPTRVAMSPGRRSV